jgi:hypothetical protein
MPKTTTSPQKVQVRELENGNIQFEWFDGSIVEMRDLTVQDMIDVDQFRINHGDGVAGSLATSLKLLELMVVKWGDEDKAPIAKIKALPAREAKKIDQYIAVGLEFFRVFD